MLRHILSGEANILILEDTNPKVGMEQSSLTEHLMKHPDVSPTAEGYLGMAADALVHGRNYKNGKLYHGFFMAGYRSQEIGCYIVTTVHRRFGT